MAPSDWPTVFLSEWLAMLLVAILFSHWMRSVLKRRIICKLIIENGVLVKYRRFTVSRRIAGNPVSTARILEDQKVDEFQLCFLGPVDTRLVREMTTELFTPVSVAGSLREIDVVDALIQECGADKVVVKDLALAETVARKYGAQAVVYPFSYYGAAVAFQVPDCAGEALLTSIDRDGGGQGYDLEALRYPYSVPVVLAGGCGKLRHVKEAFEAGADAVCVSSMFFFSDRSPVKLRSWLVSEGCQVRAA